MSEFLLEIGCEEIPAGMLEPAIGHLRDNVVKELQAAAVPFGAITTYYTPRRMALVIDEIAVKQPDRTETLVGPPKSVSYDKEGRFTKAALAFAERNKVALKAICVTTTPRGEYLAVEKKTKGAKTARLLSGILPQVIRAIPFTKSMYWTDDKFRFARPIQWIVALLDGRVIPFTIAGVAAGARTSGHRVLGRKNLPVANAAEYVDILKKNFVIVDPAVRRRIIVEGLAVEHLGGSVRPDPDLLDIVVNLNEFPSVIFGHFDEAFLKLPQEVLVTVMRSHQKYFSVVGPQKEMRPYFLTVINTNGDGQGVIRLGHQRVLRARLADAQFFWETDTKRSLLERKADLDHVTFQAKLGTYGDKTARLEAVSAMIADNLKCSAEEKSHLKQAASLAKVDLTTEMVKEFTDLQGIMGGLYARAEMQPEAVWQAVYDHYQPKKLDEPSPRSIIGAVLALTDKMDSIVGCFEAGLIPTGTRDPFALRRQGNGVIKILLDGQIKLSLTRLIQLAWMALANQGKVTADRRDNHPQLASFFESRLRYILEARGFHYDEINAVINVGAGDKPYEALSRTEALSRIRREEDFLAIAAAFKRIKNILRDQPVVDAPLVNVSLLDEAAEKELFALYENTHPQIKTLVDTLDYYAALKQTAAMRQAVDHFFDMVLVMSEDSQLRQNRIHLLRNIASLFMQVADISEIVVAPK
ncbi:MAG: glycine--tRNA ligase subunit beta [Acidobacteria bacterium]|nr:glycine--tRNA ligase subunit beta [Acidobacteriota bacterium]MBI3658019.1 glycine--tRNA ligase subunit beta [Acidobacteriota bacterium]